MLLRKQVLERIQAGEISLVFRCWQRPTVKAGGTLKTRVGVLNILTVDKVDITDITDEDVRKAGYSDLQSLLEDNGGRNGVWFKIWVSYGGADPRVELRNDAKVSEEDYGALLKKLKDFDRRSAHGPWTLAILQAICSRPQVLAGELAKDLGFERLWFKANVRKLKALGLTISHRPGYTLSPRGRVLIRKLQKTQTS